MTRVARQLSIVAACPVGTGLKGIRRAMEGAFGAELDISSNSRVGDACACVTGVQVPDGFDTRAARRKIKRALPAVRIKMMWRFHESRWARRRGGIAIGVGIGLAMILVAELLRPLAARMREALG